MRHKHTRHNDSGRTLDHHMKGCHFIFEVVVIADDHRYRIAHEPREHINEIPPSAVPYIESFLPVQELHAAGELSDRARGRVAPATSHTTSQGCGSTLGCARVRTEPLANLACSSLAAGGPG